MSLRWEMNWRSLYELSRTGHHGERQRLPGRACRHERPGHQNILEKDFTVGDIIIVPDEADIIADAIKKGHRRGRHGHGRHDRARVSARDVTPEATRSVIERDLFLDLPRSCGPKATGSPPAPSSYALGAAGDPPQKHHHQSSRQREGSRRMPGFAMPSPMPWPSFRAIHPTVRYSMVFRTASINSGRCNFSPSVGNLWVMVCYNFTRRI